MTVFLLKKNNKKKVRWSRLDWIFYLFQKKNIIWSNAWFGCKNKKCLFQAYRQPPRFFCFFFFTKQ